MKIAILSDIHDQIENLNWALSQINDRGVSHIFTLGDYTSPYIIERLQVDDIPVSAVWGNADGDRHSMLWHHKTKIPTFLLLRENSIQ